MKITKREDFEKANMFGTGKANTAYAKYFIVDSFLNLLTDPKSGFLLPMSSTGTEQRRTAGSAI